MASYLHVPAPRLIYHMHKAIALPSQLFQLNLSGDMSEANFNDLPDENGQFIEPSWHMKKSSMMIE